ncbi:MAG TPA: hypothetical protein VMM92_14960 [Thermoanaerobaculia bacterium]|nr:hypothetical protein [Thermoanaerobaculia bacterium]
MFPNRTFFALIFVSALLVSTAIRGQNAAPATDGRFDGMGGISGISGNGGSGGSGGSGGHGGTDGSGGGDHGPTIDPDGHQ